MEVTHIVAHVARVKYVFLGRKRKDLVSFANGVIEIGHISSSFKFPPKCHASIVDNFGSNRVVARN